MICRCRTYLSSSVIKKQIMAVTGLLLCGFLISHLLGNCLIYVGPEAFNTYAHTLITNPLIYVAEAGLAAIFFTHLFMAFRLTLENRAARPVKYYGKTNSENGATFASSTMVYTGFITLVFLVLHIIYIKYGAHYNVTYGETTMRDLYRLLLEEFSSPVTVIWYVFAVCSLGLHVSHGFWSAFQSIGFNHPKYNCTLRLASKAFGVLVAVGYSALPIYCFFQGGN